MLLALHASAVATEPAVHAKNEFPLLVLGALGVVYGDIGTSPIYAFRAGAARRGRRGAPTTAADVLGLLSLIVWALTITVTVKYIFFVTRADNKGEGGTLSLMALAAASFKKRRVWVLAHGRGRRGAVLRRRDHHAGDLGAVGGRGHPGRRAAACAAGSCRSRSSLIIGLFCGPAFRHREGGARSSGRSRRSGSWRSAVCGIYADRRASGRALGAQSGCYGITSSSPIRRSRRSSFGAVFLAVTGAEALYADLGHFGRKPIVVGVVHPRVSRACCSTISGRAPSSSAMATAVDESVLRDDPGLGAAADGRPRDAGDGHRQPGGDHRGLLADAAGDRAQSPAAHDACFTPRRRSRARSTCRRSTRSC